MKALRKALVPGRVVLLLPLLGACGSAAVSEGVSPMTPASWCDAVERERLGLMDRLSGRNRTRLEAAQALLAPGLGPSRAVSGLSLLGGYQEELQKNRPDVTLAALYLAAASGVPVTPELVGQVNGLLCVTTTAERVRAIAGMAEDARRVMVAERRP